ncbi:chromate resistance protein ChrB domain-containing protein [Sinimarinibacterium thermocellulolyticum]|uniref:Chromate resistance protein ChrB domain-containing protein n=1 Tax=Sinimarinibacterium thermocellulolyticum TaxID=3170016 RepID=A0ABV2A8V2_9GAMM
MTTVPLPSISVSDLLASHGRAEAPLCIDVRREADFTASGRLVSGSLRRDPAMFETWAKDLGARSVVVHCAHGRAVSQDTCARLANLGVAARYLEGGYAAWCADGGPTIAWREPLRSTPGRWITRERPKIDRIACPWLVRRFIDPLAEFFYVPTAEVRERGRQLGAEPYDIPDARFSHVGDQCSFDAFIRHFELRAPGLVHLAAIVRGAGTARPELAAQAPGLLAISLGLSANYPDDHAMLAQGMTLYDALYAWCRSAGTEAHDWKPTTMEIRP